jgi:hypothetical protein
MSSRMDRYKTFPPRWSHIKVPLSSRQAARAALAMYSPCTRKGIAVQQAGWALVSALGPAVLPGRRTTWTPPVAQPEWDDLLNRWRGRHGNFDGMAIYERPQQGRAGSLFLLLRGGDPVGFVRLRHDAQQATEREHRVLQALTENGVDAFWHPRPLAVDAIGGWHALVASPLPPSMHRPVRDGDPQVVTAALGAAVAAALPRAAQTPSHWEPMHGDLTPWNLRRLAGGRVALVDWEDAGWGPPGADAALYQATLTALYGYPVRPAPAEAAAFWRDRLERRPVGAADAGLTVKTLAALAAAPRSR